MCRNRLSNINDLLYQISLVLVSEGSTFFLFALVNILINFQEVF